MLMAKVKNVRKTLFSDHILLLLVCKGVHATDTLDVSLPSSIANLFQEYQDVFPEDVPSGLPPLRGIEHQIDLIPEATLLNRPPYKSNSKETKEMERQVGELLDKK